uniref:Reverse transcriptase domain-containing protein n=1 Tax=Graphocephala atropunctata TaxID=36148 RepID=A0A1B6KEM6_9HEMI
MDGEVLQDPKKIANPFNSFFATVAERTLKPNNLNNGLLNIYNPPNMTNSSLNLRPATETDVKKAINSLKPKTSSGIDEISAKLIKTCKHELTKPLTALINKSLQQGIFPTMLKTAKVYPKHKSGSTNDLMNYRPISLISTFSKIYEKIVLDRLLSYLEQNNLMTNQQHGFLKGRSTTTALIQLTEYIIDQLDNGHAVTSLFLDLSKAFDCLNHDQLLNKMKSLGINGKAGEWFHSYLSDRQQTVEIQHEEQNKRQKFYSDMTSIARGVPQGSVLGPVLFLLLTNDLPDYLKEYCEYCFSS